MRPLVTLLLSFSFAMALTLPDARAVGPVGPTPLVADPAHLTIPTGQTSTEVILHNTGKQAVDVRVRTFSWRAANPDDLQPTKALTASVPQVVIPAGATQVVQVFFVNPPPATELAFQLVLDTVVLSTPSSPPARSVRTGVPLFVEGRRPCTPALQAEVVPHAGQVMIKVRNPSDCHALLAGLGAAPEGQHVALMPQPRYLLSGSAATTLLPITPGPRRQPWVVAAATSQGPFRAEVQLDDDARQ